jgi:hypothetical protein
MIIVEIVLHQLQAYCPKKSRELAVWEEAAQIRQLSSNTEPAIPGGVDCRFSPSDVCLNHKY